MRIDDRNNGVLYKLNEIVDKSIIKNIKNTKILQLIELLKNFNIEKISKNKLSSHKNEQIY